MDTLDTRRMEWLPVNTKPTGQLQVYDAVPESVCEARRFITKCLVVVGRDDLVDRAATAVSELVTNAINHATKRQTDRLAVRFALIRDMLVIEVMDRSRTVPVIREPADLEDPDALSTCGRGLLLVDALADGWGFFKRRTRAGRFVKVVRVAFYAHQQSSGNAEA